MNVQNVLKTLAHKIHHAYHLVSKQRLFTQSVSNHEFVTGMDWSGFIESIQNKLLKIYLLIDDGIANNNLDSGYLSVLKTNPHYINSLFEIIPILALGLKSEMNRLERLRISNNEIFEVIAEVCYECFNIERTLRKEQNFTVMFDYKKGLEKEYTLKYSNLNLEFQITITPLALTLKQFTTLQVQTIVKEENTQILIEKENLIREKLSHEPPSDYGSKILQLTTEAKMALYRNLNLLFRNPLTNDYVSDCDYTESQETDSCC